MSTIFNPERIIMLQAQEDLLLEMIPGAVTPFAAVIC